MTDLPETLNMTLIIEPSLASAGMASEVVSTIGFGVPGLTGPPPVLETGDVVTGAPGSPVLAVLTPIGYGLYSLNFSIPAGYDGVGVQSAVINGGGHLIITLTDGTPIDAGVARGADGLGTFNGPASAIDGHVVLFDGITGKLGKDGGLLGSAAFQAVAAFATAAQGGKADAAIQPSGSAFANTGLRVLDTNASHVLILAPGSNITADRTLILTTGDADRSFAMGGNLSFANAFATVGAFGITLTATALTALTLPTTGTLATTAQIPAASSGSDVRTGSSTTTFVTPNANFVAMGFASDAGVTGTYTPNLATGFNRICNAVGNVTFGQFTGLADGLPVVILFVQDATGSRTWGCNTTYHKFPGGTLPTASTAANSVDRLSGMCRNRSGTLVIEWSGYEKDIK
jgi:hypothetical protein